MLNKIRRMLKKQEGFTLMELMIVVVIIGILGAIAVPVYNGVQNRAREGVGQANATMLNNGVRTLEMIGFEVKGTTVNEYDGKTHQDDLEEFLSLSGVDVKYVYWKDGTEHYVVNIEHEDWKTQP